jgi:hypothetical protein
MIYLCFMPVMWTTDSPVQLMPMATGLPDYTDHLASYNLDDKFSGAANANGEWTG